MTACRLIENKFSSWNRGGVEDNVKDGLDGSGLLLRLQEWSHCDFGNFDRPNSVFGCREAAVSIWPLGRACASSVLDEHGNLTPTVLSRLADFG